MLLFRIGPRHLFFRTDEADIVTDFLVTNLKGEITDFGRHLIKHRKTPQFVT